MNGTNELAEHTAVDDHYPECLALKSLPNEDPRWNTESPDIGEPLCKGTYWRFWPAITWEITIPNGMSYDTS